MADIPSSATHISKLPSEVLSDVLELVVVWEYRRFPRFFKDEPPRYPNYLSEVCVFWHQTVLDTPALWSYIDLVASGDKMTAFYARATHFLKLSCNAPLSIRVHGRDSLLPGNTERACRWLTPLINRICSLELLREAPPEVPDLVLKYWFEHGTPHVLKELLFQSQSMTPRTLKSYSSAESKQSVTGLAPQRMRELFQPIISLSLSGLFPHWDSQAYSGVAHLSLSNGFISEGQLATMLSNIPRLQTLSLDLEMKKTLLLSDTAQTLVQIPSLETLNLHTNVHNPDLLRTVLKLLVPGLRPLKVYFSIDDTQLEQILRDEEIDMFFQRSLINRLYITLRVPGKVTSRQILGLTSKTPHLRAIHLAAGSFSEQPYYREMNIKYPQLNELALSFCDVYQETFEPLLDALSPQTLRLSDCAFWSSTTQKHTERNRFVQKLARRVPTVVCHGPEDENYLIDPLDLWDYIYF
ncbi:F-box-like domain protein [Ceratobasidium sp. AG-Ba]|nr:F-box-like domain protein [Ceratobasidium sp. AG-Ba]QRV98797.1 F-box-like domain protein [Ceratobasidium sp. AG-Ba]